jgi:hypothetical protein
VFLAGAQQRAGGQQGGCDERSSLLSVPMMIARLPGRAGRRCPCRPPTASRRSPHSAPDPVPAACTRRVAAARTARAHNRSGTTGGRSRRPSATRGNRQGASPSGGCQTQPAFRPAGASTQRTPIVVVQGPCDQDTRCPGLMRPVPSTRSNVSATTSCDRAGGLWKLMCECMPRDYAPHQGTALPCVPTGRTLPGAALVS